MNFKRLSLAVFVAFIVLFVALGLTIYALLRLNDLQGQQSYAIRRQQVLTARLMKDEADIKQLQRAVLLPAIRANADSLAALQAKLAQDEAQIAALQSQLAQVALDPDPVFAIGGAIRTPSRPAPAPAPAPCTHPHCK